MSHRPKHRPKGKGLLKKAIEVADKAYPPLKEPPPLSPIPNIPTSVETLNEVISGPEQLCSGLPKSRITTFSGPGLGKTTLALNTAAKLCESGGKVLYLHFPEPFRAGEPFRAEGLDGLALIKDMGLDANENFTSMDVDVHLALRMLWDVIVRQRIRRAKGKKNKNNKNKNKNKIPASHLEPEIAIKGTDLPDLILLDNCLFHSVYSSVRSGEDSRMGRFLPQLRRLLTHSGVAVVVIQHRTFNNRDTSRNRNRSGGAGYVNYIPRLLRFYSDLMLEFEEEGAGFTRVRVLKSKCTHTQGHCGLLELTTMEMSRKPPPPPTAIPNYNTSGNIEDFKISC
jgi:hypothetical protein